jgi:CheY-like chemotaxis protein
VRDPESVATGDLKRMCDCGCTTPKTFKISNLQLSDNSTDRSPLHGLRPIVSPRTIKVHEDIEDTMPTRLSNATILVVDDEVSLRQLIVRQLRSGGYNVLEAGYGLQALEVARSSPDPIHLVLSDIKMPGMLGTELAQRLVTEYPGVRVVLMSAHPLDELISGTDSRGVVTVLSKPFEGQKMLALIKLVLDAPPVASDRSHACQP